MLSGNRCRPFLLSIPFSTYGPEIDTAFGPAYGEARRGARGDEAAVRNRITGPDRLGGSHYGEANEDRHGSRICCAAAVEQSAPAPEKAEQVQSGIDSVGNAHRVCQVIDNTGLACKPCAPPKGKEKPEIRRRLGSNDEFNGPTPTASE